MKTVTLHWPRESDFVDYQTDQRYEGPGTYEVPAKWEGHYRRRGWEDPPEDHEGDGDEPGPAISRNMEGPDRAAMEGESDPDPDAENDEGDSSSSDDDSEDGGESGN